MLPSTVSFRENKLYDTNDIRNIMHDRKASVNQQRIAFIRENRLYDTYGLRYIMRDRKASAIQ